MLTKQRQQVNWLGLDFSSQFYSSLSQSSVCHNIIILIQLNHSQLINLKSKNKINSHFIYHKNNIDLLI